MIQMIKGVILLVLVKEPSTQARACVNGSSVAELIRNLRIILKKNCSDLCLPRSYNDTKVSSSSSVAKEPSTQAMVSVNGSSVTVFSVNGSSVTVLIRNLHRSSNLRERKIARKKKRTTAPSIENRLRELVT